MSPVRHAGALLIAFAVSCAGPVPVIERASLQPFTRAGTDPFVIEIIVRSDGRGEGQIAIEADLVVRASGDVVASGETTRSLEGEERQVVVLTLPRPSSAAGLASGDVDLRVEAQYPVE